MMLCCTFALYNHVFLYKYVALHYSTIYFSFYIMVVHTLKEVKEKKNIYLPFLGKVYCVALLFCGFCPLHKAVFRKLFIPKSRVIKA